MAAKINNPTDKIANRFLTEKSLLTSVAAVVQVPYGAPPIKCMNIR